MSRRFNILMMNYEYPPLGGGGGVFSKQLAEQLKENHNVTVITSQFGDEPPHNTKNGVEIIRVPVVMRNDQNAASIPSMLSFFPASLRAGYKLLKKRQFDIVHSFFAIPTAPSGLALAKMFNLPHVLSILGGDIYDPSKKLSPHKTPLFHYTVKTMMTRSDKVVSLSSDIKRRALKHYNVKRNIDIIHLGIPRPVFTKGTRALFQLEPNDVLLVTVGRLVRRKALQDLIRVVRDIQKPNVKLLVIGDGPEREKLESLAKSLNVSDQVIFLGYISDEEKFQLLDVSDIYVSSSQHEGFGIVFLEAMTTGLPIVCYDNGGQRDFLLDEKTGFLIGHGNRELLTTKIQALVTSSVLRKEMGQFNLQYIEQFYIDSCCHRYQEIYKALLDNSPSN